MEHNRERHLPISDALIRTALSNFVNIRHLCQMQTHYTQFFEKVGTAKVLVATAVEIVATKIILLDTPELKQE